ncbi:MAG TPA: ATP-binding protein, partial [Pseudorhodoferax sp.]|nr:ATP-binding protein [Pseudorhodoferax sp.]
MPLPRNLVDALAADLHRLIADKEPEGPHLEFKRELPRGDNAGRHEFAADVSAMGNSGGGDLIYGLDEDAEGCAGAVVPIIGNADDEARRLLDVLASAVEPRLPGVQVHAIPVAGGAVFVVRVPQSWTGPHRVRTNQHFFIREGARKRQLDVPEIRGLFLRSESKAQRVRDFRTERLGKLISQMAPVPLRRGTIQVLHLVPTQSMLGAISVDPTPYAHDQPIPLLAGGAGSYRLNIDGALAIRHAGAEGSHGYSQLFRNGYLEAVKVERWAAEGGRAVLASIRYEQDLIAIVEAFRRELARLGFSVEMTAMLSFLHADSMEIGIERFRFGLEDDDGRFDRSTLVFPDVLLDGHTS